MPGMQDNQRDLLLQYEDTAQALQNTQSELARKRAEARAAPGKKLWMQPRTFLTGLLFRGTVMLTGCVWP